MTIEEKIWHKQNGKCSTRKMNLIINTYHVSLRHSLDFHFMLIVYALKLHPSTLYELSHPTSTACLTSSTSCFKIQTVFSAFKMKNKEEFSLSLFPSFSHSLFTRFSSFFISHWIRKSRKKCFEKRREGWINLIRCALLSNFSYRDSKKQARKT